MNILTDYTRGKTQNKKVNLKSENTQIKTNAYKPDVLDLISEKVVNKKDINDMVTLPRAIFKGYLCFTVGTMINAIAGMIKNKKISTGLSILGTTSAIFGTYNFVKPFLIRTDNGGKEKQN